MSSIPNAVARPLWAEHLVATTSLGDEVDYDTAEGVLMVLVDGQRAVAAVKDKPPKTSTHTAVRREATDTD